MGAGQANLTANGPGPTFGVRPEHFGAAVNGLERPATPPCSVCHGSGYVLTVDGEYARARVCRCQGTCPRCGGGGYLLEMREDGYQFYRPCSCRNLVRRVERFNRALIPAHFTFKDLDNFEATERTAHVLNFVRTFARGYPADRTGLLLVGPPGVGKTHLVVGVLKVLALEKGISCLFKDFFLLLSEVKAAYEVGKFETEVLRPLTEVEVLVVDELGKGRSNSDWEHGLLDEIVCKRYNQMKTTLLTTNFPLEPPRDRSGTVLRAGVGNLASSALIPTLEERVGERIFSRLKQMCTILRIDAADYRRAHSARGSARPRR